MKAVDGASGDAEAVRVKHRAVTVEMLYRSVLERFPGHVHALRGLAEARAHQRLAMAIGRQGGDGEAWRVLAAAGKLHADCLVEVATSYLEHGLVDDFAALLERGLDHDPGNVELLWRCGEIYRAVGCFAAAAEVYGRILALNSDHAAAAHGLAMMVATPDGGEDIADALAAAGAAWARAEAHRADGDLAAARDDYRGLLRRNAGNAAARHLLDVLSGAPFVATLPDFLPRPAPFLRIRDFLPADAHQELLRQTEGLRSRFEPSVVGAAEARGQNADLRVSQVIWDVASEPFAASFLERVAQSLDRALASLDVAAFTPGTVELQMTAHHGGGFYGVHHDGHGEDDRATGRTVSFVYYYKFAPQSFTGGDLLLYDLIRPTHLGYSRIRPADNSIVFFASKHMHEVTRVDCPGGKFRDGRFTLNGWVHPAS